MMARTQSLVRPIGGLLACVLLAACGASPPRINIEAQWRDAMGRLDLFGVYPPSEDVMVGDVFLHIPAADSFDLVRITSAPRNALARQWCYQEGDRTVLDTRPRPPVPAANGQPAVDRHAGGEAGAGCPEGYQRVRGRAPRSAARIAPHDVTPARHHATRLREEALPTYEVGALTQGEVAGGFAGTRIGAALGVGWFSSAAIRVELRELQSATLEEVRASRLIQMAQVDRLCAERENEEVCRHHIGSTGFRGASEAGLLQNALTPLMLARALANADQRMSLSHGRASGWANRGEPVSLLQRFCTGDFQGLNEAGAAIVVANRVLYAGGIAYNFASEEARALRTAIDLATALGNRTQPPRVLDLPAAPGSSTTGSGQQIGLDGELATLVGRLGSILTLPAGGPGEVRARLGVGQFGNLALERDFRRPLAVGMGAALRFSLADAAVPTTDNQIHEVVLFCRSVVEAPTNPSSLGAGKTAATDPLEARMRFNRAWLRYLAAYSRSMERPGGEALPEAQASARAEVEGALSGLGSAQPLAPPRSQRSINTVRVRL